MSQNENHNLDGLSDGCSVRCTKGQVSIFLVFLFQVLFVFFCMVVNVGMLVYYKINLQNSVDLAAYYAAMKQAEVLNTIGHINYQIRQSWKLLAYRATVLGTLGPDLHPARPSTPGTESFKPYPGEVIYGGNPENPKLPVFCVTIAELFANQIGGESGSVKDINDKDNQCRYDFNRNLPGFKIPDLIWTLPGYNEKIRQGSLALQDQFLNEFSGGGMRNYLTLASFIILFRSDSLNRRKALAVLANSLSQRPDDFWDLDQASVLGGAEKVLRKNLADQNDTPQLSVQLLNSLAHPGCGGANSNPEALPGWLKEIDVNALFLYMDSDINASVLDGPEKAAQAVNFIGMPDGSSIPVQVRATNPAAQEIFRQLDTLLLRSGIPQLPAGRWTSTVGVEKNPWCVPYIAIKAVSSPRLPFMPARFTPQLMAKTYAKPFGSRIGPWYGRSWPDKSPGSTSDRNPQLLTDTRLPPRQYEGDSAPPSLSPKDQIRLFPNYSRFVGDTLGLLSEGSRWSYGKHYWRPNKINLAYWTTMWRRPVMDALEFNNQDSSPFFMGPRSGDPLADAYRTDFFPPEKAAEAKTWARDMRQSEIAAIAPDLFDITYYSIEPRFNQFVLPRLQGFIKTFNSSRPELMVRGDLGWRHPNFAAGDLYASESANIELHVDTFRQHPFHTQSGAQVFYIASNIDHLLTSWAEKSIIDYNPDIGLQKLGSCSARVPAGAEPWLPGACVQGGRTGYSVKLVSKKFLNSEIPHLGGVGVSGALANPPDPEF